MVGCTALGAGLIITGGAALPAVTGMASGVITTTAGAGGAATVLGSAGAGTVAGALTGATGTAMAGGAVGTASTTAVGALAGGASATAYSSASYGAASLVSAGISAGPVGWLLLGANQEDSSDFSWDCWKPVIRETSLKPSNGVLLRDLSVDPRIKRITYNSSTNANEISSMVIENIWEERFRIEFIELQSINKVAAHATRID